MTGKICIYRLVATVRQQERRKSLRRFPPFFMNNSEYRSLLNNKKYETETEDTYGEGEGRVYESDEDPLDLYSQVEGKIEIKIR